MGGPRVGPGDIAHRIELGTKTQVGDGNKVGTGQGVGPPSEDESGLDIVAELQALGHEDLGDSMRYASGPGDQFLG